MSFWTRLFGRKSTQAMDVRESSHWNAGDIAVCIRDNWLPPLPPDAPSAGTYWTVDGVEDAVYSHPAISAPVRGLWLHLIGVRAPCDARSFRKVVHDIEEADEQFTALIKRPVRRPAEAPPISQDADHG